MGTRPCWKSCFLEKRLPATRSLAAAFCLLVKLLAFWSRSIASQQIGADHPPSLALACAVATASVASLQASFAKAAIKAGASLRRSISPHCGVRSLRASRRVHPIAPKVRTATSAGEVTWFQPAFASSLLTAATLVWREAKPYRLGPSRRYPSDITNSRVLRSLLLPGGERKSNRAACAETLKRSSLRGSDLVKRRRAESSNRCSPQGRCGRACPVNGGYVDMGAIENHQSCCPLLRCSLSRRRRRYFPTVAVSGVRAQAPGCCLLGIWA